MESFAVIEYLSKNNLILHIRDKSNEYVITNDIKESLNRNCIKEVVIVKPFYIKSEEVMIFTAEIGFKDACILNYSDATVSTFDTESLIFLYINMVNKNVVDTVDCGSIINGITNTIEKEEIKKVVLKKNFEIQGFIEFMVDGNVLESKSKKFDGFFEDFVIEFYNLVSNEEISSKLAQNIYVYSKSEQVESIFKSRFAMNVVDKGSIGLGSVVLLEIPTFIKQTPGVWKNIRENAAVIGAFKYAAKRRRIP